MLKIFVSRKISETFLRHFQDKTNRIYTKGDQRQRVRELLGTRLPGAPLRNENFFSLLRFPIQRLSLIAHFRTYYHAFCVSNCLRKLTTSQPRRTVGTRHVARECQQRVRRVRSPARVSAYAFPSGPLRAFRKSAMDARKLNCTARSA